jgi:hypothetical protein
MPDCFISHASVDAPFAASVRDYLKAHDLDVFLAPVSIVPGEPWSQAVLQALRNSKWVIFLASRAACQSAFVQQEVGGAIVGNKTLIPVVWDISPEELPAWAKQRQALDLRGMVVGDIAAAINSIGRQIRQDRDTGRLVALALIAGFLYVVSK